MVSNAINACRAVLRDQRCKGLPDWVVVELTQGLVAETSPVPATFQEMYSSFLQAFPDLAANFPTLYSWVKSEDLRVRTFCAGWERADAHRKGGNA